MSNALQSSVGDPFANAALHHCVPHSRTDHLHLFGFGWRRRLGGGFELEHRDPVGNLLAFLNGCGAAARKETKCK